MARAELAGCFAVVRARGISAGMEGLAVDWKSIEHFEEKELHCPCCGVAAMDEAFMLRLDAVRRELGQPMRITSGYRCARRNFAAGGAERSAHMSGKAVDIAVPSGPYRLALLRVLLAAGFRRIGIGQNIVHVDAEDASAGKVDSIWVYPA